ncbi:hypothetical protein [Nocardiopsis sp. HUAS JQ3]|uniref:hypothetical protein n=1 Tax=Nocardiopsis sp. HUAS JQ3 TaxID=3061629 RepID=UPI0023A9D493|nr:hypothetical protein [Nocardiopsis sp. HUAS JQ3]WDZ90565.1 hypothetical protein PV789_27375 [Nocardiopsis sp. HUAS JQ3]
MKCPHCEEDVQEAEPLGWNVPIGPTPAYSHLDGSELCPEVTSEGYRPAQPVPTTSA